MLCIVSAIYSETKTLVDLTGAGEIAPNVWRSEKNGVIISALGVGYLTAAIELQSLLNEFTEIDRVLFCGTAGVYAEIDTLKVGQLVQCYGTKLADGAAEMTWSHYADILNREEIKSDLYWGCGLSSVSVLTALTLTLSDELAGVLARNTQCELENMELFGIASVCKRRGIPWDSILGITNTVGKDGSSSWVKNHNMLERLACQFIFQEITE